MAWYKCIGSNSGGISLPTKYWHGTQDEYDNLSNYSNDTIYNIEHIVTGSYMNNVVKIMIGQNQIFPYELSGYDWYMNNMFFPDTNATETDNLWYSIDMGILLGSSENINKNWQMEFKATLSQTATLSGDQIIVGTGSNEDIKEIYLNTSGNLCISANGISDTSYISNANGYDIKIIRDGSNLELYKDGILVDTLTTYSQSLNTRYYLGISRYTNNYRFHGTIEYFKFKWLS